jgi:hypothetical protein
MLFRVEGPGWPVGDRLIPSGAVIDLNADPWRGRNLTPPLNATALDDECWQLMRKIYPSHLLGPPPPKG